MGKPFSFIVKNNLEFGYVNDMMSEAQAWFAQNILQLAISLFYAPNIYVNLDVVFMAPLLTYAKLLITLIEENLLYLMNVMENCH